MFNNVTINKFQGLNNSIAPELLGVGELRDILNFRHEKIGKLVNRNGVVYGLYTKDENEGLYRLEYIANNRFHDAEQEYINNNGFVGLGEYITDGRFDACDTDKFMVYACIGYGDAVDIDGNEYLDEEGNNRRFLNFLISPLTGRYTNYLFNFGVTFIREEDPVGGNKVSFINTRNLNPQDLITSPREPLFAPRSIVNGLFTDPNTWVDAFLKMTQYRHSLIISDRTNGDSMIEDEFNLRTGQECLPENASTLIPEQKEAVEHNLRIRPNALDKFDIDIVDFDLRLGDDEENALSGAGIETAMALYQFEVEKDTTKTTIDYYLPSSTMLQKMQQIEAPIKTFRTDEFGRDKYNKEVYQIVSRYMNDIRDIWEEGRRLSPTPLHIRQFLPSWSVSEHGDNFNKRKILTTGMDNAVETHPILEYDYNTTQFYRYTNEKIASTFNNLGNNVRLVKTETKDEDGEPLDSYAAGVYLWNDLKLNYEPVQSKTGNFYLSTAEDREFDRAIGGAPRIVEFEDLEGRSREVPLTGWKYRFVWDYGNDVLSAPSTDIVAPDLLWRAAFSDNTISSTDRVNLSDADWNKSLGKFQNVSQLGEVSTLPKMFDENTGNMTDLGYIVWRIKKELYDLEHIFGSQVQGDSKPAVNALFSNEQKENFSTLITVVGGDIVKLEGIFAEGITISVPKIEKTIENQLEVWKITHDWEGAAAVKSNGDPYIWVENNETVLSYLDSSPTIIASNLSILVPLIPRAHSATYNSLFDIKGKLRTGYLNNSTRSSQYMESQYAIGSSVVPTYANYDYNGKIVKKQMIFTGYNAGIKTMLSTLRDWGVDEQILGIDYFLNGVSPDIKFNPYIIPAVDRQFVYYGTTGSNLYSFTDICFYAVDYTKELTNFTMQNWAAYMLNEAVLSSYSPRTLPGIVLNFVCLDNDINNTQPSSNRVSTLLRLSNSEQDRLVTLKDTVKTSVVNRIILEGKVNIQLLSDQEEFYWDSQYFTQPLDRTSGSIVAINSLKIVDTLAAAKERLPYQLQNAPHSMKVTPVASESQLVPFSNPIYINSPEGIASHTVYKTNNIDASIYLDGERLLAIEQLTSIFPSSLLFNAPRLGLTIPTANIPRRAKRLKIFRTLSTVQNEYDPLSYGLVEDVEIFTTETSFYDSNMEIVVAGEKYTTDEDGNRYKGVYYFDKIKDVNLDFTIDIEASEGLRRPIHSRFNMPLNERMYYANFKQYYQPEPPRLAEGRSDADRFPEPFSPDNFAREILNTHYYTFETADLTRGFVDGELVQYAYAYEDAGGILSAPKYTQVIDPCLKIDGTQLDDTSHNAEVVLFYLPNGYNGSIEHLNIYRKDSTKDAVTAWYSTPENEDLFDASGLDDTVLDRQQFYFDTAENLTFFKIGKTTEKDLGIFYDYNKLGVGSGNPVDLVGTTHPVFNTYESAIIYSEPYRPDFIKQDSFMEIRSGDGEQITGLASLYGNLIILKENSIHRVAVQAETALPSRTDEVSPDVGCIAPESLITVDNFVYFLSHQGIMVYDNNQLLSIDEKINEEIRTYLRYLLEQGSQVSVPLHRFITAGYNPEFREIYFNFPILQPFENDVYRKYYDYDREFLGHIYVFQVQTKLWYKFGYGGDLIDIANSTIDDIELPDEIIEIKRRVSQLGNTKIYYTNSLGEMRSANVSPSLYNTGHTIDDAQDITTAFAYVETPYDDGGLPARVDNPDSPPSYKPYLSNDDVLDNQAMQTDYNSSTDTWDSTKIYPPRRAQPIKVKVKTQFVTLDRETILKRLNRIVANIYSEGEIEIKTLVNRRDVSDERIANNYDTQTFIYAPTAVTAESNPHPITNIDNSTNVTNTNVLTAIPIASFAGDEEEYTMDDSNLKGISFSVEIASEMRTQVNEVTIYTRPIHIYLQ